MKKILIVVNLSYLLFGHDVSQYIVKNSQNNSFITKYEYGKMLYHNPRGISCAKCHGIDAKGKLIAKFVHIKRKKQYNCQIKTYDITTISKDKFFDKLDYFKKHKRKKFDKTQVCEKLIYGNTMPKYFLTKSEMESIYYYIKHIGEFDE